MKKKQIGNIKYALEFAYVYKNTYTICMQIFYLNYTDLYKLVKSCHILTCTNLQFAFIPTFQFWVPFVCNCLVVDARFSFFVATFFILFSVLFLFSLFILIFIISVMCVYLYISCGLLTVDCYS